MSNNKYELPDGNGVVLAISCALCDARESPLQHMTRCPRCERTFCTSNACYMVHLRAVDDERDYIPHPSEEELAAHLAAHPDELDKILPAFWTQQERDEFKRNFVAEHGRQKGKTVIRRRKKT